MSCIVKGIKENLNNIDLGEDLLDGLSREILEEVGLAVRIDRILYAISRLVNPQRQIFGLTYLCYANTDKVIFSNEHRNFLWAVNFHIKYSLIISTLYWHNN